VACKDVACDPQKEAEEQTDPELLCLVHLFILILSLPDSAIEHFLPSPLIRMIKDVVIRIAPPVRAWRPPGTTAMLTDPPLDVQHNCKNGRAIWWPGAKSINPTCK